MFFHKKRNVHGLLLLDKPQGISSNDALQQVKFIFKAKKAGHIGTLDPLATGVLPICFGESTKFSHYLNNSDKKYHVVAKLGETTSTSDSDGIVIKKRPIIFTELQLYSSINQFIGSINQIPSMYSAIKHKGVSLYKYARKGINIIRHARQITVYSIDSIHQKNNLIEFQVCCSKGTYIRTLIEDLGEKLGCGAHIIFLRRLKIGSYSCKTLTTINDLYTLLKKHQMNNNFFEQIDNLLLPIDSLISFLPKIYLSSKISYYFKLGQIVNFNSDITNSLVRVIEEGKKFIGLGKINTEKLLIPYRLLSASMK